MAEPDTSAYVAVMDELKRRIAVVDAFLDGTSNALYRETGVESMVLQIRMILELIALGSLAAHKALFEQNRMKFEKHWKPVEILRDVAALNPNFYPQPVDQVPLKHARARNDLVPVTSGFLTQGDLIEVHGRCGNLLHASNPYGKKRDFNAYERTLPVWRKKIIRLLDSHVIHLLNDDRMYLVQMSHDGGPNITTFQKAPSRA